MLAVSIEAGIYAESQVGNATFIDKILNFISSNFVNLTQKPFSVSSIRSNALAFTPKNGAKNNSAPIGAKDNANNKKNGNNNQKSNNNHKNNSDKNNEKNEKRESDGKETGKSGVPDSWDDDTAHEKQHAKPQPEKQLHEKGTNEKQHVKTPSQAGKGAKNAPDRADADKEEVEFLPVVPETTGKKSQVDSQKLLEEYQRRAKTDNFAKMLKVRQSLPAYKQKDDILAAVER